jgi:hypothetical protein
LVPNAVPNSDNARTVRFQGIPLNLFALLDGGIGKRGHFGREKSATSVVTVWPSFGVLSL